ncbi:MAG: diheme cytochrome c [Phyllobacteriaceae bacterium]|nr:diheme cytochrome c [Phyllobacteriaceae bacterium]
MKRLLLAAALLASTAVAATAADRMVTDEMTKAECAACHIAYPPRLLPAANWEAVMAGLQDHFGEVASLDDASVAHIRDYLVANAGKDDPTAVDAEGKPLLRISERRWFVGEHKGEVSEASLKKAGTWANCVACHKGAEKGQFDDD